MGCLMRPPPQIERPPRGDRDRRRRPGSARCQPHHRAIQLPFYCRPSLGSATELVAVAFWRKGDSLRDGRGGRVGPGGQLCGCAAWLLSGGGWAEWRAAVRARCWARSCRRVCWSCRLISVRAK
jgi:hypothetical protein